MANERALGRWARAWVGAAAALIGGASCGGDDDDGGAAFLQAGPACAIGAESPVLELEGSLAGEAVMVALSGNAASGGLVQLGEPSEFAAGGVLIHWSGGLSYGESGPILDGTLTLPEGQPSGATTLCITSGEVGFTTEGLLRFRITGLAEGSDCAGEALAASLDGCWETEN